ncbi:MAG: reverse transcriptase domain-containing protein [Chromatiales bacterium]|jgi:hypothetical protein
MTQPLFEQLLADLTLDAAYEWHAETRRDPLDWAATKEDLRARLADGGYAFEPLHRVHTEDGPVDTWADTDCILLKAMTLVLEDALGEHLSGAVYHRRGGARQAVEAIHQAVVDNPGCWVVQSEVAGFYAHIDHAILYQRVADLIPQEKYLLRLVWQYLAHSVEDGGRYRDVERGIARGCSLSPLMAALYLCPLDEALHGQGIRHARYMDDWVALLPTRWRLRDAVKAADLALEGLKLARHPDKTFIGRVERGFDFLGYRVTPEGLAVSEAAPPFENGRRDERVARLYEQGADANRIERYLSHWQAWAQGGLSAAVTIPRGPRPAPAYKRFGQFALAAGAGLSGVAHGAIIAAQGLPVGPLGGGVLLDLDGGGSPDVNLMSTAALDLYVSGSAFLAGFARVLLGSSSLTVSSGDVVGGRFTVTYPGAASDFFIAFTLGPNGGALADQPGWFLAHWSGGPGGSWSVPEGFIEDTGDTIHVGTRAAAAAPVPPTLPLLGAGAALIGLLRRRQRSRASGRA